MAEGDGQPRGLVAWSQKDQQRLLTWDPIQTPPSWMTHEVFQALEAIGEPHMRKKRTTVLRMAEGLSTGMAKRSVLLLDETCNASTWYGNSGSEGWKDDPAIAHALDVALSRANWWYEQEEGQRLALRLRNVSAAQDEIADLTAVAVQVLRRLMEESPSDRTKLDAAVEILDRADQGTARKAQHDVTIDTRGGPSMAEVRNRVRRRHPVVDGEVEVVEDGEEQALLLQDIIQQMGSSSDGEEDDGDLGD